MRKAAERSHPSMELLALLLALPYAASLVTQPRLSSVHLRAATTAARSPAPFANIFEQFLKEVDNFVDDAVGRRLGNGANFYGKRKSSFYGEEDEMRKQDADQADAEEDYNGPAGGSFFVLGERDEQGRPLEFLTRQEARKRKAAAEEAKWKAMAESDQGMSEGFLQALMEEEERKAKEREFEP